MVQFSSDTNPESFINTDEKKTFKTRLKRQASDIKQHCIIPVKQYARTICTVATLKQRVPILQWLPNYRLGFLLQDILAGLSVGLTVIPQGIYIAFLAGLEPQYGLYSAFVGCFVYFVFGGSKDVTVGPTVLLSLMIRSHMNAYNEDYVVLLTFLGGIVMLLLGFLHTGFLFKFISSHVMAGFGYGTAVTIMVLQKKYFLGLSGDFYSFMQSAGNTAGHIATIKLWDSLLGIGTVITLWLLKRLGKHGNQKSEFSTAKNILRRFNWHISNNRYTIVIIVGTFIAWVIKISNGTEQFALTGEFKRGMPPFRLPPFSTVMGNETHTFPRMVSEMGSTIITLPLLAILESVAIAKIYSMGKTLDVTQEMLALGLSNIFGSFFGSMPTTGSFFRTSINNESGVKTLAGGIITGFLVLLCLGPMSSLFYFVPKPTLAAVIISSLHSKLESGYGIRMWKARKIEFVIMIITFDSCLFLGVEYGICIGIILDIIVVLLKLSRPSLSPQYQKLENADVVLLRIPRSLNYCAAERLRSEVLLEASIYPKAVVVIDGSNMRSLDTTIADSFKFLMEDMEDRSQNIIYWQFTVESTRIFKKYAPSVLTVLSSEPTVEDAVNSILQLPSLNEESYS